MNQNLKTQYDTAGYVSAVPILTAEEAKEHRAQLEAAESKLGPLHYQAKIHTVLETAWQLATHPRVVETIKLILGPDVLLHNATYIIKEPHSTSHVSWHQDLTYWGFNNEEQVTMWLALSHANEASGSMTFLPGTHIDGQRPHELTDDPNNVLLQGQTIKGVDASAAELSVLQPGEASFHHGWIMHSSTADNSDDRRIGLNVQYITPATKQMKSDNDTAILVCGEDNYGHFAYDTPAQAAIDEAALARQQELNKHYQETAGTE